METLIQMVMQTLGPIGIGLLMFLEDICPPIPSELIMPLAGYLSTRGEMNILIVIMAGTVGSLAGAVPWYFLGKHLGHDRVRRLAARQGRWLTMSPADVDAASQRFKRHGKASVLLGRLVPTVRTLISIPAGVANMPVGEFLFFSAIGSFIWTTALALAGYLLSQAHDKVADYVGPISTAIVLVLVGIYLYRVATYQGGTA